VARLIRSKGVGVYFVTQNPDDIPEDILGQLGNRVQHALRAFTARDQKALRQAAETYRPNPRFEIEDVIRDVGTGEALTSFLEAKGAPGMAERTLIRPPSSQLGPITPAEREQAMQASPVALKYDEVKDRESAYEILKARAEAAAKEAEAAEAREAPTGAAPARELDWSPGTGRRYSGSTVQRGRGRSQRSESIGQAVASVVIKELKGTTGRRIVRGILGGMFRGR
ncbi:MAG: helicase HerA-like domain-containing protein, partial [Pseudomonadota bacterium]